MPLWYNLYIRSIYKKLKKDVIHLFGDRLKDLRKEKGVTQPELASLFNVTTSTVSAWEVGKAQPNYDILIGLADYFNVTTDYLLGLNQDDHAKIEKLRSACQEAGLMAGQDFTLEEFEKAMLVVETLRDKKNG